MGTQSGTPGRSTARKRDARRGNAIEGTPISPRRDQSGAERCRGARGRSRPSHELPGRNPIARSLDERTGRKDPFAGRVQLDSKQTRMTPAHEQVGRGNLQDLAGRLVLTVFHQVAPVLFGARAGTAVGAGLGENARRFQGTMLGRRQPGGQQQQTEKWEKATHPGAAGLWFSPARQAGRTCPALGAEAGSTAGHHTNAAVSAARSGRRRPGRTTACARETSRAAC